MSQHGHQSKTGHVYFLWRILKVNTAEITPCWLTKASYSIKENLWLLELQFKLLLHAFRNSFITIHWMFNVHNNFMCKRQEHVISCVPYPTELSHMLVTCYTVIWRITQLYAQVFLTPYVSHSSCSTCRNVTSQTRTSALSHITQDTQFLMTWWHNFFVPIDIFLYSYKTNTFVKKENNTCNSENNFLMYNTQGSSAHQQNA